MADCGVRALAESSRSLPGRNLRGGRRYAKLDAMGKECFGLVGGLGIGAAIHYYRELAKAHDALHVLMDLVMVHADMPRMVRWAEAGMASMIASNSVARLSASL